MNANERELILKEEVYQIVGAAMEVSNVLGARPNWNVNAWFSASPIFAFIGVHSRLNKAANREHQSCFCPARPPFPYSDVCLLPYLQHSFWFLPDVIAGAGARSSTTATASCRSLPAARGRRLSKQIARRPGGPRLDRFKKIGLRAMSYRYPGR